tara:strand:+ start:228 stop:614 length:387 start_codon:yes stop_codon:yes gene_type:complete
LIFGIGTDIVDLTRITRIHQKYGDRLAQKILGEKEFRNIDETFSAQRLATQFAVKEATVKALGVGFRGGVQPSNIHLDYNRLGKPSIRVSDKAAELFEKNAIRKTFVSVSHDKELVLAFVVLESSLKS